VTVRVSALQARRFRPAVDPSETGRNPIRGDVGIGRLSRNRAADHPGRPCPVKLDVVPPDCSTRPGIGRGGWTAAVDDAAADLVSLDGSVAVDVPRRRSEAVSFSSSPRGSGYEAKSDDAYHNSSHVKECLPSHARVSQVKGGLLARY